MKLRSALKVLRGASWWERLAIAAYAAVLITAATLIGQGIWIKGKEAASGYLLERAWVRMMDGEEAAKPWPWAKRAPAARGEALSLGKAAVVFDPLAGPGEAPGRHIFTAHDGAHLRFLKDLRPGDTIRVTDRTGTSQTYSVRSAQILREDQLAEIRKVTRDGIALVGPFPFNAAGGGLYHFVVEARIKPGAAAHSHRL